MMMREKEFFIDYNLIFFDKRLPRPEKRACNVKTLSEKSTNPFSKAISLGQRGIIDVAILSRLLDNLR
jgi:hypothetical protein